MTNGLSSQDAKQRLLSFGYNELQSAKPKTLWKIISEVIREPMFLLLISCGVLYIILGDYKEGLVLLSTILVIVFITFYQYQKTERALEALKNLASPRALVIRDNQKTRIPGREVVPDDIVIINEGDRVAADGFVLDSTNLTVDESILSGESVPVRKETGQGANDHEHVVFSGTLVVQGTGSIKVTATGTSTEIGKIGTSLRIIEQDETRLQKEMKGLIRTLFVISVLVSIAIFVVFYLTRGNLIQSMLRGLSSAMALLPEEFPVVLTIFLAVGAWRLSRIGVLTRKPSAIETLGAATILCSDKTGTITQNKMEVAVVYNGTEKIGKTMFNIHIDDVSKIIIIGHLASRGDSIDPMENAISRLRMQLTPGENHDNSLLKEYPLTKESMMMTRVTQNTNGKILVSAKGAPESVLALCKLEQEEKEGHLQAAQSMARAGLRVIAVASTMHGGENLPDNQRSFQFVFEGLIGLEDPVRPEVKEAIRECRQAGIRVIMITGDFPETARSIASQI